MLTLAAAFALVFAAAPLTPAPTPVSASSGIAPVPAADALPLLLEKIAVRQEAAGKAHEKASFLSTVFGEELDKTGKATETTEVVLRHVWKDGAGDEELVRYVENGKDVTEAKKKAGQERRDKEKLEKEKAAREAGEKKEKEEKSVSFGFGSPFGKDEQPSYTFTQVSLDAGKAKIAFKPKGKASAELMTGEATVDVATGDLERMTFRPSVNPRFVSKLSIELEFGEKTPFGKALSRMKAEGEGGFLLIKKRFRMTSTFTEYAFPPD